MTAALICCAACGGATVHPAALCCACIGRLPATAQADLDRAVASGGALSPLWRRVLPIVQHHAREVVRREREALRHRLWVRVRRRTVKAPHTP